MKYFRCKCGEHTAWSSMGVPECVGCEKCKTTLAEYPGGHCEIIPHDWREEWKSGPANVPPQKHRICLRCSKREDIAA